MKTIFALMALTLVAPTTAFAERSQIFGDIEVHYNAISTDELAPEVARSYKLDRSKNRGLLTLSVLKKNKLGVGQPIKAEVSANAVNLSSQLANVTIREVQEGSAIYYLGEFRVSPPDTLKFNVTVKPVSDGKTLNVEFEQKFYP